MKKNLLIHIFFAAVLFLAVFLTLDSFIEKTLLSKWYVFTLGALLSNVITLILYKTIKIKFDLFLYALLLFIGYILVRMIFSDIVNIKILSPICFLLFLFFFKFLPRTCKQQFDLIIVGICILQCIYGLMQFAGIFYNPSPFNMLGSFDNPAGYAVCLCIGYSLCFILLKRLETRRIIIIILMIILLAGIIISGSRTGLITVLIITGIYIYNQHNHFLNGGEIKIGIVLFTTLFFIFLVFVKKDSASGRILVWQASLPMITERPVFGGGKGFFLSHYMEYQAHYFEYNPDSRYTQIADNVAHPFNEYLLLIIEYGIIGLVLFLFAGSTVLRYTKTNYREYILPLIAVAVFACFSYPLHYPVVIIVIAYCLSRIEMNKLFLKQLNRCTNTFIRITGSLFTFLAFFYLVKDVEFEYKWSSMEKRTRFGKIKEILPYYETLDLIWNGDPFFLYNYGALLNRVKKYEVSLEIASRCKIYLNDYDIQLLLADNFFNLERWDQAENHYHIALYMCPNRFIPLKQLHRIALIQDNKKEAHKIALLIVNKPVKINSSTIEKIKNEMKVYLENENTIKNNI